MLNYLDRIKNLWSGWQLHHITKLVVQATKYEPLAGNRYMTPLPRKLMGKRAIANMKNNDNKCFKWAVTRALHYVPKDPARITKELRKQSEKYDWDDVIFPMQVKDIGKWERRNNIGVNVFGYDEDNDKLYTIKICDHDLFANEIANLYLHDDFHYCAITNPSRFASMQISKHKCGKCICYRCWSAFGTDELLVEHKELCGEHKTQRATFPTEKTKWLCFRNYAKMHKVPIVGYANKLLPTYRRFHEMPIKGKRTVVEITFLPKLSSSSQVNVTFPKLALNVCVVPDSVCISAMFENTNTKSWFKNNLGRLLCRDLQMRINSSTVYDNNLESLIMVYKDLWLPDKRHEDMSEYGIASENLRKLMSRTITVFSKRVERG